MTRRRIIGYAVRATLSVTVLAVLAWKVDFGEVAANAFDADPRWIVLGLALLAGGVGVRILSFMVLANHRGSFIGFRQATYLTLVGSAAALVLPAGTGDLFKAHIGGRSTSAPERITVASVVDKLTSLSAVSSMGVVGGLVAGEPLLAAVAIAVAAISTLLVFVPRLIPWRLTVRLVTPGHEVSRSAVEDSMRIPPPTLALVLGISVLGWLVSYTMIYALCRSLAVPVSFGYVLAIAPLVTLSTLLPLSVAGIGISQLTLVAMLANGGIALRLATQVALLQLGFSLLPPLVGLILYLAIGSRPWDSGQHPRAAETPSDPPSVRVAMLTTVYPRYECDTVGSFVASTAESVAKTGLPVSVWAPHAPELPIVERMGAVVVHRFRYLPESMERLVYSPRGIPDALRRNPASALLLPFLILGFMRAARKASRDADIIHAHWAPVGALAGIAVRHTPIVVTLHGTDVAVAERSFVWRVALRLACRRAALVLPVSDALAARVARLVDPSVEQKMRVIGNGIEPALLDVTCEAAGRVDAVFVGRLIREKGAFDALRSFALLGDDSIRLVMIGGAGIGTEVTDLAAELGVSSRVSFLGALPREEVIERIRCARAVVIPSLDEGFSMVALEAAALGTPVVASRVGAIPDILGADAALHEPGDTATAAAHLRRVLDDQGWADSVAKRAREVVEARFIWPAVAAQLRGAYAKAIGRVGEVR